MNKVIRWFLVLFLSFGALFTTPVIPVRAATTFTVTSTADAPDANPGNGICLSTAIKKACTLRAAIMEANALAGADTILLQVTTYTLTVDGNPATDNDDNSASGDLDITSDLTIQLAPNLTGQATIQGGSGWSERILEINGGVISISNAIITNGNAGASENGGGILFGNAATSLNNVTVQNNISAGNGGGIAIPQSGFITLTNCLVTTNTANGSSGGGGIFLAGGNLTINNSSITNNVATNTTLGGGGIFMGILSPQGSSISLNISSSAISGNTAQNGGGILVRRVGANIPVVQFSTINNNTALVDGGGIFLAPSNGDDFSTKASIKLINSTLSGNTAKDDGGGVFVSSQQGNGGEGGAFMANVTVALNIADSDANGAGNGGGIFTTQAVSTNKNTMLAGNIDSSPSTSTIHSDCSGTVKSEGYNLFQSTTGCTIQGNLTGNILNQAPTLGPLQNNGGTTPTHASFAIGVDGGNPAGCTDFSNVLLANAQNGVSRHIGVAGGAGVCDIGAYEFVQPA